MWNDRRSGDPHPLEQSTYRDEAKASVSVEHPFGYWWYLSKWKHWYHSHGEVNMKTTEWNRRHTALSSVTLFHVLCAQIVFELLQKMTSTKGYFSWSLSRVPVDSAHKQEQWIRGPWTDLCVVLTRALTLSDTSYSVQQTPPKNSGSL